MLKTQHGFTLIELVMVIVIFGILAAVIVPKFIDLRQDAQAAHNMAYICSLRSAVALRYVQQIRQGGKPDVKGSPTTVLSFLQQFVASSPDSLTVTDGFCSSGAGKLSGLGSILYSAPVNVVWTSLRSNSR
jgi:MSHA pilin protein MshA